MADVDPVAVSTETRKVMMKVALMRQVGFTTRVRIDALNNFIGQGMAGNPYGLLSIQTALEILEGEGKKRWQPLVVVEQMLRPVIAAAFPDCPDQYRRIPGFSSDTTADADWFDDKQIEGTHAG